jgi:hypothetical protein
MFKNTRNNKGKANYMNVVNKKKGKYKREEPFKTS